VQSADFFVFVLVQFFPSSKLISPYCNIEYDWYCSKSEQILDIITSTGSDIFSSIWGGRLLINYATLYIWSVHYACAYAPKSEWP